MKNSFLTKGLPIKFGLLQATYWCAFAAFSSFAIAFLQQERGFSSSTVGVFLTVNTLFSFAGLFFWTNMCDKAKSHKLFLIITSLLTLVAYIGLYVSKSQRVLLCFYAMLGFVQNSTPANLDTWILKTYSDKPSMYGPIRSCGSIAYAIFMLVYGGIIDANGFIVLPIFAGIFLVIVVSVAFITKDAPEIKKVQVQNSDLGNTVNTKLFSKSFIMIVIIMFCMGLGTATFQLMPIIVDRAGGNMAIIGYACFVAGFIQFFIFAGDKFLSRLSPKMLLIIGAFLNLGFMIIVSFIPNSIAIIIGAGMSGAYYGFLMLAIRPTIQYNAPSDKNTTAQGIGDAVLNYLAGIVNSLVVAIFSGTLGMTNIFIIFTGIVLVGVVVVLFNKAIKYKPKS